MGNYCDKTPDKNYPDLVDVTTHQKLSDLISYDHKYQIISDNERLKGINNGTLAKSYLENGKVRISKGNFRCLDYIVNGFVEWRKYRKCVDTPEYFEIERCDDRKAVLEILKKDGRNLFFASIRLRNDRDVVLKAIDCSPHGGLYDAFRYAGDELANDKDFVLEVVKKRGDLLSSVIQRFKNDKEVVTEAVKQNCHSFCHASKELLKNRKFILRLLENVESFSRVKFLRDIHPSLREDPEFVRSIYKNVNRAAEDDFSFFNFLPECVDEKKEEMEMKKYSDILRNIFSTHQEITKSDHINVCDIFPLRPLEEFDPGVNVDLYKYEYIGKGAFGRTYLLLLSNPYISQWYNNGIQKPSTDFIGLDILRKKLYYLVLKIYRGKDEKKRVEESKKDYMRIPYHKNIANIYLQVSNGEIDVRRTRDYETYWKKGISRANGKSDCPILRTGMIFMTRYKQDLGKYMERRVVEYYNFASSYRRTFSFSGSNFAEQRPCPILLKVEFCRMLRGIIHGLCHLHENFIVHRDLHARNIFVLGSFGRIQIGDFGLHLDLRKEKSFIVSKTDHRLKESSNSTSLMKGGGSSRLFAPEILNFDEKKEEFLDYSKFDIYSLGNIALDLLYCNHAIPTQNNTVPRRPNEWGSELDVEKVYSDHDLVKFVKEHLCDDPKMRIGFKESKRRIDEMTRIAEDEDKKWFSGN